jgi:uncharacterized protein YfaS (alpha-2-macroglobulin family)
MKRLFSISITAVVLLACCFLYSCKQQKERTPSADFIPYIAAYTGGMVTKGATIVIELTKEQPEEVWKKEVKEKLFSFSPALKGSAHWLNGNTIEFVPADGELKPGATYNATFELAQVMKVEKIFSKFDFSFHVEERTVRISTKPMEIQPDNTVRVRGELTFGEQIKPEDARKALKAEIDGAKMEIEIDGDNPAMTFPFVVKGITRTSEKQELTILFNGAPVGIDHKENLSVNIPVKDKFELHEYKIVTSPDYGVQLTFSGLVSETQDPKGLIALKNVSNYSTQVRGNQVMIYFPYDANMTEVIVVVDRGLKNQAGEAIGETKELRLSLERLKPQVEILTTGTIMPGSEKLILPFRTVALRAVDLRIIRIFENNVPTFLQDNRLSSATSNQLRRAGRIVYKNTLRLDSDPTRNTSFWENYSLDLSRLIRQQPGAVYRIELSFKQEYASYACEDQEQPENALPGAVDLTSITTGDGTPAEEDERYWDEAYTYHSDEYDIKTDWNIYDWRQRDNPCHPTYYMVVSRKATIHVLASDLGVIAKCNADHTTWVAVTNLLDTKPVPGAKVTAYNFQLQPIGNGSTDENGFCVLSLKSKPFILTAGYGAQKAYLRMADGDENPLSRFDIGGVTLKKGLKGYLYGERGVWRPGDTLHLAFMLEDREKKIPANHPVSFEIYNPQGLFYKKMVSNQGENGLYTFHLPTRADDPTGLWNAYVKVGGATFHKGLRIETVKPNRLKINLDLPPVIHASKSSTPVSIHAQWLTGATAHKLAAKTELTLTKAATQFKGYEKYIFNNPATNFTSEKIEVFDGQLNDTGDATFHMPVPPAENAPGMLRANITCRVFEPGGDASIFSQSVPFSPYDSYVGIHFNQKEEQHSLYTDEDHVFDIVTVSPEGKPVSRQGLEYKIYRIGWSWWWESQNESFESYINNSNYTPLYTGLLNTTNGKGQIKFRIDYPDWGRYLVLVRDPSSGHATGGAVLVDWPSWRGRSGKSDPTAIKMLTFSLDKADYKVGDEVLATIPATASDGRALVAIENGSEVLFREWVNLTAGSDTKYTFRVTGQMAPNVYIHISLLLPHASTTDLPIRMYGIMPVFVTNEASVLKPVITMTDVLRPETGFEVHVKEQSGKPMTYTLALVDDGLLDLTHFQTPDPWNEFYAREALGIRTWDLFDEVMGAYAGKYGSLYTIGGDGEIRQSGEKANRFKPVVLYVGPVTLKAGEEKKHTLRLPSYVGSVRVMVVAGQDGAYGKADKTVAVRAPLMLLSSLPRVLSAREQISLPVNVFAMENEVKKVTVTVETTGKLKATDGNSRTLTFTEPGDGILYFPMATDAETGIERVTITAKAGEHTSTETIEIEIRNPNPPLLTFQSKLLEKGESVTFDYHLDATFEENWVKAEISRIPSVDLNRRFDYLYNYKHCCTEQLTSRALPLLFVSDFKELSEKEIETNKKNITAAIQDLYGRQVSNGGFCYWPGQGHINDWVTSYAGSFLIFAKERGYDVSSSVIRKWIGFQRSAAQNWRPDGNRSNGYSCDQSDYLQACRLYTLALADAPEIGAMNRLKEVKELSLQSRWRLAAAYALCGKQEAAGELIFNASTSVDDYSSHNPTCGSSDRDEAMILEALTLMGKQEEAFRQAQKVSANLSAESYFSTQTTACALVAMAQFAAKMSGRLDFEWFIDGKKQPKATTNKAIFQTQLPAKPASGSMEVKNGNEGILYFSLATKTRPVVDQAPASAENLDLKVSYTDMNGDPIDVTTLQQGTDFYAVVRVSNISGRSYYPQVALTQIFPSGWEIFNERMVAASVSETNDAESASPTFNFQDIRDDCVFTYFDLPVGRTKEIKIRLQASYIGDFVFPAILCEAMYDASARARTAAGRVTVRK